MKRRRQSVSLNLCGFDIKVEEMRRKNAFLKRGGGIMEQQKKKHGGVIAVIIASIISISILAIIFALYEAFEKRMELIDQTVGGAPAVEIRLDFDKISEEEQMLWDI